MRNLTNIFEDSTFTLSTFQNCKVTPFTTTHHQFPLPLPIIYFSLYFIPLSLITAQEFHLIVLFKTIKFSIYFKKIISWFFYNTAEIFCKTTQNLGQRHWNLKITGVSKSMNSQQILWFCDKNVFSLTLGDFDLSPIDIFIMVGTIILCRL